MNIQGIQSKYNDPINVLKIQPGQTKAVEKAAKDNQLDEMIVENDQGQFLIYGRNLELAYDYADQNGITYRTLPTGFIGAPEAGDQVILGDLKGKLVFFNDTTERMARASEIGAIGGGFAGVALGMIGSKGNELSGGMLGGVLGYALGLGVVTGLTYLVAKPDYSALPLEKHGTPVQATF